MTLAELRNAAARMLGFKNYAQAKGEEANINSYIARAVYKVFQPDDQSRARFAEEPFGLFLPAAVSINLNVLEGQTAFSTDGAALPESKYIGSYITVGNRFYTYSARTDATNGSFVEPYDGESGVVTAKFYHNSIALDDRVFSIMGKPQLVGYGNLSELSGKRQEIKFRSIVYNDYWPHDGSFFYNAMAVQQGINSSFLVGVPAFYFIDETAFGGNYIRRFTVHPLPEQRHSIGCRASVAPAIPSEDEVPFPGPADMADVVLIPILEKICMSNERYAGKNQGAVMQEYASALATARRFNNSQKRRPVRFTVRRGY